MCPFAHMPVLKRLEDIHYILYKQFVLWMLVVLSLYQCHKHGGSRWMTVMITVQLTRCSKILEVYVEEADTCS